MFSIEEVQYKTCWSVVVTCSLGRAGGGGGAGGGSGGGGKN